MKRTTLLLMIAATIALAASVSMARPQQAARAHAHSSQLSANSAAMSEQATIRQRIVDKTLLRLGRIRIVNGFKTDIGLGLATEEQRDDADSPPSMNESELGEYGRFGIFDGDNEQEQTEWDEGKIPNTLITQVRWFHPADWDAAKLRQAIGDIKKAIIEHETTGERDATFGGLLVGIKPARDGFVRPQETFQVDACAFAFAGVFLTEPFNDYE